MKRIWLIRHGQSLSQSGEDEDAVDPELSRLGNRQAGRLEGALKDVYFDIILISPLRRAWQTFKHANVRYGKAIFDSRIIESDWNIGDFYADIQPVIPPDLASPDRQNSWQVPVEKRVSSVLADLSERSQTAFALFGHWGIFNQLLQQFSGINTPGITIRAPMDNAAVSLLEIDNGQHIIRYWNDRSHVIDLLEP